MSDTSKADRYLELALDIECHIDSEYDFMPRGDFAEIATALRRLAEIESRQSRPTHSCDIPGCMSCGNPPDSDYRLPEHKE
jgi:hypothetical protein